MNKLLSHRGHDRPVDTQIASVTTFFETLRTEQERLLKSLRQASAVLDPESGQLAALAAMQVRLTQRFFDAQRGLLRHRAAVDAEVAQLRSDVETEANRLLLASGGPGAAPESVLDVAALAQSIDSDASLLGESSADAQNQLSSLLDAWWTAEVRDGRDRLDDATARATMVHHLIEREADSLVTESTAHPMSAPAAPVPVPLPGDIASALDDAESKGLDVLLRDLAGYLGDSEPAPFVPVEPAPVEFETALPDEPAEGVSEVLIRMDGREPLPFTVATAVEVAERSEPADASFWPDAESASLSEVQSDEPSLLAQLARVILPVAICTVLFGLLMVWIG